MANPYGLRPSVNTHIPLDIKVGQPIASPVPRTSESTFAAMFSKNLPAGSVLNAMPLMGVNLGPPIIGD